MVGVALRDRTFPPSQVATVGHCPFSIALIRCKIHTTHTHKHKHTIFIRLIEYLVRRTTTIKQTITNNYRKNQWETFVIGKTLHTIGKTFGTRLIWYWYWTSSTLTTTNSPSAAKTNIIQPAIQRSSACNVIFTMWQERKNDSDEQGTRNFVQIMCWSNIYSLWHRRRVECQLLGQWTSWPASAYMSPIWTKINLKFIRKNEKIKAKIE